MQQFAPRPGFDRTLVGVCSVARHLGSSPLSQQSYLLLPLTLQLLFILANRQTGLWKSYRWASDGSLNFTASQSLISVQWVSEWEKSAFKDIDGVQCRLHNQLPAKGNGGSEGEKCPLRSLSYVVCSLCGLVFIRREKCWLVFPRKYVSVTLFDHPQLPPHPHPSHRVSISFLLKNFLLAPSFFSAERWIITNKIEWNFTPCVRCRRDSFCLVAVLLCVRSACAKSHGSF